MVFATEEAVAVNYPVCGHFGTYAVAAVHGPAHHAGRKPGTQASGNGAIGTYTATGYLPHYGINLFKKTLVPGAGGIDFIQLERCFGSHEGKLGKRREKTGKPCCPEAFRSVFPGMLKQGSFAQAFGTAGFGYFIIIVGTVAAAIATAGAFGLVVELGENHITIFT